MNAVFKGYGSGKLILFGEHAVVYGEPAIAAALPHGAQAKVYPESGQPHPTLVFASANQAGQNTLALNNQQSRVQQAFQKILNCFGLQHNSLKVQVSFDLPVGAGLGSSAAMAAAIAQALAQYQRLEPNVAHEQIQRAVAQSEIVFHSKASGIDQTAALGGGVFVFQRHPHDKPIINHLNISPFSLVICKPGNSSSTADMVQQVARLYTSNPDHFRTTNQNIGRISRLASQALCRGNMTLVGDLMDQNHQLLRELGVSTPQLDRACEIARNAGALGAKLTGAGGGGCVIALVQNNDDAILSAWRHHGWSGFQVTLETPIHHQAAI